MNADRLDDETDTTPPRHEELRIVMSNELFGEEREIVIEHNGVRYRLRITRRGKLILQK